MMPIKGFEIHFSVFAPLFTMSDIPFTPIPYTSEERAMIQAKLNQPPPRNYIATRSMGSAGQVAYIPGNLVITLLNEVFGFDGWHFTVKEYKLSYVCTLNYYYVW